MLDSADIIAVLVIARPVRFHSVDLHLQVCFPLGIDKFRVIDVCIVRQIGRRCQAPQASGSQIGKKGKTGRQSEKIPKAHGSQSANDRVALNGMDHTGSNLFRSNGGIFCPLSCFCASRAALAYWRFSFCFGHIRASRFFFSGRNWLLICAGLYWTHGNRTPYMSPFGISPPFISPGALWPLPVSGSELYPSAA